MSVLRSMAARGGDDAAKSPCLSGFAHLSRVHLTIRSPFLPTVNRLGVPLHWLAAARPRPAGTPTVRARQIRELGTVDATSLSRTLRHPSAAAPAAVCAAAACGRDGHQLVDCAARADAGACAGG